MEKLVRFLGVTQRILYSLPFRIMCFFERFDM